MIDKQKKIELKRQVHHLNPVVMIGNHGLSDAVHHEIDTALTAHELIKIRINANDRDEFKKMITTICEKHNAEFIHTIGHVVAIYREREIL